MKIKYMRTKTRRILYIILASVILFFLCKIGKYNYYDFVILNRAKPSLVWEFVADFNNMKKLNPTINDFNILSESGNFDHWKYSVQYSENLSHWPYFFNEAIANFDVKSLDKGAYKISSQHNTCLLFGRYCLQSNSEFKFTSTDNGALCEETVEYECPIILSSFCKREVKYQRSEIMKNLQYHFSNEAIQK